MKIEYEMREVCVACSSPYQIIGAIGIVTNRGLKADLYVFGTFSGFEEVANRIKQYNYFENVYIADPKRIGRHGKWMAIKKFIVPDKIVSSFMPVNVAYKYYYTTSRVSLKSAQLKVLRDRNPGMRMIMYDDGMGSYSGGGLLKTTPLRAIAEKLLHWNLNDPKLLSFMAYLPSLVKNRPPYDICSVEQQPRIEINKNNRSMLEDIFSVDPGKRINNKCIILDTSRYGDPYRDKMEKKDFELLDSCFDIIVRYTGADAICKPHPKSKERTGAKVEIYPYQGIPMEVLYAGMLDLKDRILVTFVSTAAFTPKILYNIEPLTICLHRILYETQTGANFDPIFNKFRDIYVHKDRLLAPGTIEELDEQLKEWYIKQKS